MEKQVYCVLVNGKPVITFNKREAHKMGDNVRALSYGYYKDCGFVMDYPTFYAVSHAI